MGGRWFLESVPCANYIARAPGYGGIMGSALTPCTKLLSLIFMNCLLLFLGSEKSPCSLSSSNIQIFPFCALNSVLTPLPAWELFSNWPDTLQDLTETMFLSSSQPPFSSLCLFLFLSLVLSQTSMYIQLRLLKKKNCLFYINVFTFFLKKIAHSALA